MRRRMAFLSTLIALAVVLVLPTSALAATFTYQILDDYCTATGGDYGYGYLYFEVKQTEFGKHGANKMTFTGVVQHRNLGSTRWRTDYNYGTSTNRFSNTSANTWRSHWYDWYPADGNWHRIKVTLKVWHDGILLAKKTVVGEAC